jgi:tight adherence protein B
MDTFLVNIGPWPWLSLLGGSVFTVFYVYNERILNWLRVQSIGTRDYIMVKLDLMFIEISPNLVLLGLFACSFGLGFLVFLGFLIMGAPLPGVLFGAIMAVVGWKAPKPLIDFLFQKRIEKFGDQLVEGLGLMANGIKSSMGTQQTVALVVEEMPNPISQEFGLVLNQMKLGVTLEEAFVNLAKRIQSEDVDMFVTAVVILEEQGGDLGEAFDTIIHTIRERIKVEKKIQALTAMGLYQGVGLFLMPFFLGTFLFFSDPDYLTPLFTQPLGWILLLLMLALQAVGGFLVLKISKVNV